MRMDLGLLIISHNYIFGSMLYVWAWQRKAGRVSDWKEHSKLYKKWQILKQIIIVLLLFNIPDNKHNFL